MVKYALPAQPTAFVGRTQELAEIIALLDNPDCRLLTLVGAGGMGKTRLALQAGAMILAREDADGVTESSPNKASLPDGVYFAPLQPLTSPDFIHSAVADAVGVQFYSGCDPQDQLVDYFRPKALLLILDNFEHLLNGVGLVTELLTHAPNIKILTTSRETLNLQEEWLYPVKGMHFPDEEGEGNLERFSAVRLFVQSARRVRPDFSLETEQRAVLRICQLVDGMPLALEMTAAWLKRLPAEGIVQQLERGLDILESSARNMPERHRSMRAVFEHSWNLLTDVEREVFKKISIFRGGFRQEAADAVAGGSLGILSALVDKSLLWIDSIGRYDQHELLRQYAEEQLNATPEISQQTHQSHCEYYMDFLAQRKDGVMVHTSKEAKAEVFTELKNIRSAWDWAIEQRIVDRFDQAGLCLLIFYQSQSLYREGEEAFGKYMVLFRQGQKNWRLAGALLAQGWFIQLGLQDFARASALFEESLAISKTFNDEDMLGDIRLRISDLAVQMGDYERARRFAQDALDSKRKEEDHWTQTFPVAHMGKIAYLTGNYPEAVRLLRKATELAQSNNVPVGIVDAKNYLGQVELIMGHCVEARNTFAENFALVKDLDYPKGEMLALIGLGEASSALGDYEESRRYFSDTLKMAMRLHEIPYALEALVAIADQLAKTEHEDDALKLVAFVLDSRATTYEVKSKAQRLFAQLEAYCPEAVASALEAAKASHIEEIVESLFALTAGPSNVQTSGPLGERELEILRLTADGLSNREIAEQLFLAVGTVKWYLGEIYGKLHVASRTQAVARARELNLLT